MNRRLLALGLLFVAACSDDAPATSPDAGDPDAAVDATDGPPARCPGQIFVTGEYTTWGSTPDQYKGIANAQWSARPPSTASDTTNPNGRVELCVAPEVVSVLDVTGGESAIDGSSDTLTGYLDAIFVADPAVYASAANTFVAKGLTADEAAAFYAAEGPMFDPTKAQVLIHIQGPPVALTLDQLSLRFALTDENDTSWENDGTGYLVLFTNVSVGSNQVILTSSPSSFTGPTTLPVEAGVLTFTSIRTE